MAAMGLSAAGDRGELDRRLRDELDDGGFRQGSAATPRRPGAVPRAGRPVHAGAAGRGDRAGVLDHPAVDVPQQDLRTHLIRGRLLVNEILRERVAGGGDNPTFERGGDRYEAP